VAYGSKVLRTESDKLTLDSCSPVPDLAVLLLTSQLSARMPQQQLAPLGSASGLAAAIAAAATADRAAAPSAEAEAHVSVLQGFAEYDVRRATDAAVLLWLRSHLQLLLELLVSGSCLVAVWLRVLCRHLAGTPHGLATHP
jgi:trans-aconitate methyltransferase